MDGLILFAAAIGSVYFINKIAKASQHPAGLNHSLEHLKQARNNIAFWPREIQAKYADEVCKKHIDSNDKEFIKNLDFDNLNFENINATSIGNLAYIYLNCKSDTAAYNANQALKRIKLHDQKK